MNDEKGELARIKFEYAQRAERLAGSDLYSRFNQAYLFMNTQLQRECLGMLREQGIHTVDAHKILEIGCGSGGVLLDYLLFGSHPNSLFGVDILFNRLREAHARLPGTNLSGADGQYLPYSPGEFDIVLQYTVFSSVLDNRVRIKMAKEILRVLKKPTGFLIWYDFWANPTNPQTRGIQVKEMKRLFPDCQYHIKRITLAPPIARKIVPLSWLMSIALEKIRILNTHYLAIIQPNSTG